MSGKFTPEYMPITPELRWFKTRYGGSTAPSARLTASGSAS